MLNLRKIIEDQQAFFKKMINDSLDKSFDRKYKKISLVLTLLILIVTSIFAYKANQILLLTSNSNNEVSMQLRRNSIRPILRVSTKRVSIGDNEGQALIISFANIGTGTAKDINLFIEDDKTFIREPIRRFFPKGILPILKFPPIGNMPLVAQTKPIIKLFERMPVYPDTISGQNFIRPDEVLEVQFGCYKYGKIPPQAPMIFYISYYDIDENEYLTITPQISGFDNIFSNPSEEAFLFDTLRFLASDLFFYEYKTLENTKFRIKGGSFRDEFLQKR